MAKRKTGARIGRNGGEAISKRVKRRGSVSTRQNILDVATTEFAEHGLAGARVDVIAERTFTSKRMIYYHFGSKEALYRAVLEQTYLGIRASEEELQPERRDPVEAIRALISLTFDYDQTHPEFISLVSIENLNRARYLSQMPSVAVSSNKIIRRLSGILECGRSAGVFRAGLDAIDIHMMISAMCIFRVANRYTFQALFKRDLCDAKKREHHKNLICETVLRLLAP